MPSLGLLGGNLILFMAVTISRAEASCSDRQSNRIVGGVHANPGEFPFIVRFINGHFSCAGSIIDDRHILTAAHCFFDHLGNKVRGKKFVFAGCHNRDTCRVKYDISSYVVHQNYRKISGIIFPYDIAVMRTRERIRFKPGNSLGSVGTIELAGNLNDDVQNNFIAIGWGDQRFNQPNSDPILRKVTVPNIPLQTCNRHYKGANEKMICAGQKDKDSCQGDSGGPLVVRVGGGSYEQVGIVSTGDRCGSPYGGVYTRVAAYRQWIQDSIDRLRRQSVWNDAP